VKVALDASAAAKAEPTGVGRYVGHLADALLEVDPALELVLAVRLGRWRRRRHAWRPPPRGRRPRDDEVVPVGLARARHVGMRRGARTRRAARGRGRPAGRHDPRPVQPDVGGVANDRFRAQKQARYAEVAARAARILCPSEGHGEGRRRSPPRPARAHRRHTARCRPRTATAHRGGARSCARAASREAAVRPLRRTAPAAQEPRDGRERVRPARGADRRPVRWFSPARTASPPVVSTRSSRRRVPPSVWCGSGTPRRPTSRALRRRFPAPLSQSRRGLRTSRARGDGVRVSRGGVRPRRAPGGRRTGRARLRAGCARRSRGGSVEAPRRAGVSRGGGRPASRARRRAHVQRTARATLDAYRAVSPT